MQYAPAFNAAGCVTCYHDPLCCIRSYGWLHACLGRCLTPKAGKHHTMSARASMGRIWLSLTWSICDVRLAAVFMAKRPCCSAMAARHLGSLRICRKPGRDLSAQSQKNTAPWGQCCDVLKSDTLKVVLFCISLLCAYCSSTRQKFTLMP